MIGIDFFLHDPDWCILVDMIRINIFLLTWSGLMFFCWHDPKLCIFVDMIRNDVFLLTWSGLMYFCWHDLDWCIFVDMIRIDVFFLTWSGWMYFCWHDLDWCIFSTLPNQIVNKKIPIKIIKKLKLHIWIRIIFKCGIWMCLLVFAGGGGWFKAWGRKVKFWRHREELSPRLYSVHSHYPWRNVAACCLQVILSQNARRTLYILELVHIITKYHSWAQLTNNLASAYR